jgi:NAD(P)-dependent dehydrogenase (short-subunit alcohol dehydrogenase family)
MVARGGHVVNLGSIAGRRRPTRGGNVCSATKAAVGSLTRNLRIDLLGTGVRVTNIEPGMVETEFSLVCFSGDAERHEKVYQGCSRSARTLPARSSGPSPDPRTSTSRTCSSADCPGIRHAGAPDHVLTE